MTPQQQTTQRSEATQPATTDTITTNDFTGLLDSQTTIDPDARGDAYIPIQETSLPEVSLADLSPGTLLYNPRQPSAVLEVTEQYQDDFGKEKIRATVHSSDHRNGRTHSLFVPHVIRDFTYIQPEENTAEPDDDVELSVDALTSAWNGDTATEEDTSEVQTTLAKQDQVSEDPQPLADSQEKPVSEESTQQTLF